MARPYVVREAILSLVATLTLMIEPTRDRPLTTDEFKQLTTALLVLKGWGEDIR